ncbi:MAG TPA: murein biosynthesis integral membrane protein MurJ [Gaiellaceae bacterium]|nr:murein biosynthesis integral membrane protein MurJ [Gaiellaceae bacterium]
MEEQPAARGRRLAWSTAIFALATGLSRILGLVREIVAAYYFGAAGKINAFTVAFQVPNLVRSLVADAALSSAFVPVFSELLEKGDRKRAWRVASSLFWLMLLGLGALTALFIVIAPLVIAPFGDPGGDKELAIGLSRVLFPIVALLGVSGVIVGILNSYEQFTVPAITPVFWNLAIIAGLVLGVPNADSIDAKLYVYAISIVVGTVIQVLLPVPWLRGLDGRLQLVVDWRDPAVRRVFTLMVPVTIGLGLINFNLVVDSLFASRLIDPELAPTAIDKAFRIYMLPQGMFSVAVATVLFPSLSRLATRGDYDGFRHTVGVGLRQIAFLLVPASALAAVLALPIVRLLYERGQFGPHQTHVVAGALAAFAAGLTFNGTMLLLNRAFFSLQSPWTPTAVALANLGLNAVLDAVFYRFGTWGIPLSTTLVNMAGTAALLELLRRRLGRIEFGETARAFLSITLAAGVLAAAAFGAWWALDHELGRSTAAQIVSLLTAIAAGFAIYAVSCRLLGVRELGALLSLRSRRAAG